MVPHRTAPCMVAHGTSEGGTQGGYGVHSGPDPDCTVPGAGRGPASRSGAGGTSIIIVAHLPTGLVDDAEQG
jgi:hypothetical protein